MLLWPASPSSPTRTTSTAGRASPILIMAWRPAWPKPTASSYRRNLAKALRTAVRRCKPTAMVRPSVLERTLCTAGAGRRYSLLWKTARRIPLAERRLLTEQLDCPDESVEAAQRFAQKLCAMRRPNAPPTRRWRRWFYNLNTMHSRAGAQIPFSSHQLRHRHLPRGPDGHPQPSAGRPRPVWATAKRPSSPSTSSR